MEQDGVHTKPKGMKAKEKEVDKEKERKMNSESKQRGRSGLASGLRLWLPLLSVCTEMSECCDILPYSFPCT